MDAEMDDTELLLNLSYKPIKKGKYSTKEKSNNVHEDVACPVKGVQTYNGKKRKLEQDFTVTENVTKKHTTIPNLRDNGLRSKFLAKPRPEGSKQSHIPFKKIKEESSEGISKLYEESDNVGNEENDLGDEIQKPKKPSVGNKTNSGIGDNKVHGRPKVHIASLYKGNPELPHIRTSNLQQTNEPLFTQKSFEELNLHPHLVSCLKSRMEVSTLTEVQENAIPVLLEKKDALVKSCTGSGKTLAYSVPIVQQLQEMVPKIQRCDGVYALVIVPTRELAVQSFECFSALTKAFTWIVPGYLIGGEKKKSEKARIRKGINILISTPGRLLDHLEHTQNLDLKYISWLVIDEADKLLEQGYEESMLKILNYTNQASESQKRQSVLLSATLSKGVEKLAGMSLVDPVYIDVSTSDGTSLNADELIIPSQLKQFVVFTPTKLKLVTLSAFLIDKCASMDMKALIFFATLKEVDFYYKIFSNVLDNLMSEMNYECTFLKLHGSMAQEDRFKVFNSFKAGKSGILLCTDVAARGLDLPSVDWIIQYSIPTSPENYVHRVGRTARIGKKGCSVIFLIPSEVKFVDMLRGHKIQMEELPMQDLLSSLPLLGDVIQDTKQRMHSRTVEELATAMHMEYENLVYSNHSIHESAKDAFLAFVQSYASYPKVMRDVTPFKMLHLGHVAKSFCLRESPSELGCKFAKSAKSRSSKLSQSRFSKPKNFKGGSEDTSRGHRGERSVQRKSKIVSEFSSGFDELKKSKRTKVRKLNF